jgi:hypothetical protein
MQITRLSILALAEKSAEPTPYLRTADAVKDVFSLRLTLGYPAIWLDHENNIYCADCAKNSFFNDHIDFDVDIYWEGPDVHCECCNTIIKSAYGDPDSEEN